MKRPLPRPGSNSILFGAITLVPIHCSGGPRPSQNSFPRGFVERTNYGDGHEDMDRSQAADLLPARLTEAANRLVGSNRLHLQRKFTMRQSFRFRNLWMGGLSLFFGLCCGQPRMLPAASLTYQSATPTLGTDDIAPHKGRLSPRAPIQMDTGSKPSGCGKQAIRVIPYPLIGRLPTARP